MRVTNPATDELLRELGEDDSESIRVKLLRARAAQRDWACRPFAERATIVGLFGEIVASRREDLARTLTLEVGKPISQSRRELEGLQARVAFFLEHSERELAEQRTASVDQGGTEELVRFEPLGVVANVSAWNYPYFVGSNVFVPALLTGNSVLYKPSEHATLTGLEIERALGEAGVPRDVFQTLVGGGPVGAALVEQPVDGVFFTGSLATGRRIAAAVAPRMIPLGLELGGKDPAYVADDVDVAAAAAAVADGAFYNAGQSCCAVERVYVQARIWQPFVDAFVDAVRGFKLGDPLDEATYVGPLARRNAQLSLLIEQVQDAVGKGARLLAGGRRAERAGWFFEPTVLVDVDHSMRVMREESFGPIIGLMPVPNDERALELMADTEYGLTAAVYSNDRARAERILSALDVGSAYWNCCDRVSPRLPWSGRHCSGIGCTLGSAGIRAFLKPKAWHLRPA
jgi:acyl-CoA reductase-like NAD-dependent aldehyde dehydrogenase